jgi:hypothetical protein
MATRADIPAQTAEQMARESQAFRRIAALLGKDGWDDTSALVEVASDIISDAGFPHPGTSDNDETYLDFSNALWEAEHPEAVR